MAGLLIAATAGGGMATQGRAAPALVPGSASMAQEGPCPADVPIVRWYVEGFLKEEDPSTRETLGLTEVADEPLRLLGGEKGDAAICAQLYRAVPKAYTVRGKNAPDRATFYQVGNRYILALTGARIREGIFPSGPEQYMGFDLDLQRIGGVIVP